MIFAEALVRAGDFQTFTAAVPVPVLANMTEFGKTPLLGIDQLRELGVRIALYPLSAFRAMSLAALNVYQTVRETGTQAAVVESMQTRDDLYRILDYLAYERKLDELFEV